MRKLKLSVEELEVTSFETLAGQDQRGTVGGHVQRVITVDENTCQAPYTCDPDETCIIETHTCLGACLGNPGTGMVPGTVTDPGTGTVGSGSDAL